MQLVPEPHLPPKNLGSSIKNYFNRSQLYDANSKIIKELDSPYAIDMLPYWTSDHKVIRLFVQTLNSRYKLPDKNTLKCTFIPKEYDELNNTLGIALSRYKY